ncbi:hypothetical protein [Streptomonospora arabica]|uniref:Uncharacterized protein n=1 Tax=Streptomonospora arabica TaxID=412417 RepID=A0ABV9SSI0_9ACTN
MTIMHPAPLGANTTTDNAIPDAARIAATIAAIVQSAGVTREVAFSIDHFGERGERPTVTVTAARWVAYADREELLRRVARSIGLALGLRVSEHHGRRWISGSITRDGVDYLVTSALSGGEQ